MLQLLGIVPSQEGAILPKLTYASKNSSHFLRQARGNHSWRQPKGPPEADCGVRGQRAWDCISKEVWNKED